MSDAEHELRRTLDAYAAAVFATDIDGFMRPYHPAVRVFDAWGVWLYEGAPAWQVAVEGWFASLGSDSVRVSFSDVQATADHAMAFVNAIVTFAAQSAQGEPLRSMQNRITWVLRRDGDVFRIVHEHTSAPIGFEDGKAILARGTGPA